MSHDIDRAITGITEKDLSDYSKIDAFKKEHALRSASIICGILQKYDYSSESIDKVRHLVEKHEVGGDDESDILMNADSLAYFDYNIPSYLKRNGRERTIQKVRFMFSRLSLEARNLVAEISYTDPQISELIKQALDESA